MLLDQDRICGLLRLIVLQTEYAVHHAAPIELKPIVEIYQDNGLYKIAQKTELLTALKDLWTAAESHNAGLTDPGGTSRSGALLDCAKRISDIISKYC